MDLSILIPVKNRVKLTRACLESLLETLPAGIRTEILVQDNGSTDGTRAYLESLGERVRVLQGSAQSTFAQSNNTMAQAARGQTLCLLNNDTVLLAGWIEPMLALFESEPRAGVVGNVQLFPGGVGSRRINHAGVVFDSRRTPTHLYEGMPEGLVAAGETRELQAVTAACSMIRRETFHELNGFDERYRNGHEDIDLCLRARRAGGGVGGAGYSNWVVGQSRIVHLGCSTPGRLNHDDQNTALFQEEHFDSIVPDLARVTQEDGIEWPVRSGLYRATRALWRFGPTRVVLGTVLRTRLGMRGRQVVLHRLCRSK